MICSFTRNEIVGFVRLLPTSGYMENPPAQVYMLQHFMNSNFYKLNYQRLGTAAFLVVLTLTALICGILFVQRRVKRHVG